MKENILEKLAKTNIINEYTIKNMTTKELSEKYGISAERIRIFLISNNVPRKRAKRRNSLRSEPPVGKTFGQWTVISDQIKSGTELKDGSGNRCLYWLCKCACGSTAWKSASGLQAGRTLACKSCAAKSFLDENGVVQINTVLLHKFNQTKAGIVTRKNRGRRNPLTFNIDCQDIINLYESQNHKCALSGIMIEPDINKQLHHQNISIDRIDSFKGYEKDNIQLVDKRINMMKGSLSDDEFIDLCVNVALYRGNCVKI